MFVRIAATALVALSLAACATQAKYKAKLDTWVGQPAQSLVNAWGYPASQMTAPNGNQVYVYQTSGSIVMPTTTTTNAQATSYGHSAYGTATSTTYGGQTIALSCTTYFEIYGGTVVKWNYQGNACKST